MTADEILPRVTDLSATVTIDDRIVARCSSGGMRYSIGEALAHACREERLFAGELFGTGTLPGGCALENGGWLTPGCRLKLTIDGVGEIVHSISLG